MDSRLRRLGGGEKGQGGDLRARLRRMARLGRLEGHAPVVRAIRTAGGLRLAAEMEIRAPRLADRPAAVVVLEVDERLVGIDFLVWRAHVQIRRVRNRYRGARATSFCLVVSHARQSIRRRFLSK
jgi:hypothetical protein